MPEYQPTVRFKDGAKEVVKYYKEYTAKLGVDKGINDFMNKIISDFSTFKANCTK